MNRQQRRRALHPKNRQFTKKGYTRVIKLGDDNKALNIPTKIGSRIHKQAITNVKRLKKGQARSE